MTKPTKANIYQVIAFMIIAIFYFFSRIDIANSATSSINVSESMGRIQIDASGSFPDSNNCNTSSNQWCEPEYRGCVEIYVEMYIAQWKRDQLLTKTCGEKNVQASIVLGTGSLSLGKTVFRADANPYNDVTSSAYYEKIVEEDNMPKLTINNLGKVTGPLKFSGTAIFKEVINYREGDLAFDIDGSWMHECTQYCEGTNINWELSNQNCKYMHDSIFDDAANLSQGEHKIRVHAFAYNGQETVLASTFTVDNTPELGIIGLQYFSDNTLDIIGTVTFKERIDGYEGNIYLSLSKEPEGYFSHTGINVTGSKEYNEGGGTFLWKFSEITGNRLPKDILKENELKLKATAVAYNRATAKIQQPLIIPPRGCPLPIQ